MAGMDDDGDDEEEEKERDDVEGREVLNCLRRAARRERSCLDRA
jgi:hypothetical protein